MKIRILSFTLVISILASIFVAVPITANAAIEDCKHLNGEWNLTGEIHWKNCECGERVSEEHTFEEIEMQAPTHTSIGILIYECTVCGFEKVRSIEKIPHVFDDYVQYDNEFHMVTCECGTYIYEDHTWNDGEVIINPTATEDGIKLYTCTACGRVKTETIPADSTGGWTTGAPPTSGSTTGGGTTGGGTTGGSTTGGWTTGGSTTGGWTTGGSTTGGWTTGGSTTGGDEIVDCTHYWNVEITPATCGKDGVKTSTCVVCGCSYTEVIPATGNHTYGDWEMDDAENHKKVCGCGDIITEAHAFNEGVVQIPATETTVGLIVYTCTVCEYKKAEVIPATGTGDSTTGGSTTGGSTTGGSTTGGSTTGGSTTGGSTTGGTTTGGGETDDPCETGHTWDAGVVTQEPTLTEEGVKTYTCAVCGYVQTEVIDKLVPEYKPGDSDGDGEISIKDVIFIRRFITGRYGVEINEETADVNKDGEVNVKDVILIRRYIIGGYGIVLQ